MNWFQQKGDLPTPSQVALTLMTVSRELDDLTRELKTLDEDYVEKKIAFESAYARAFLTGEGSVDARKQGAVLATSDQKFAMELAESRVRSTRAALATLRDRIEVGRSLGAAVRSELIATSGMAA